MRDHSAGPDEPAGWVSPHYIEAGCRATIRRGSHQRPSLRSAISVRRKNASTTGRRRGDADERIRAVIDAGEAIVADVLQAGAAEGQDEPIGRFDWNLAVVDAVDEEQGRCAGVDLIGGRCPPVYRDAFAFRRAAHEALADLPERALPVLVDQVDRPAVADHRLDEARLILMRAIAFAIRVLAGHAQEHREVAAGRIAEGADVVRVEVVVPGVGPQPSDGGLAVVERGRERGLAGEPVVDRYGDEAERGEVHDVAGDAVLPRGEAGLVPLDPSAAVDDHDTGPRLASQVFLHGEVQLPVPAGPFAV